MSMQLKPWNPLKAMRHLDSPAVFDDLVRDFGLRPSLREMAMVPEMRLDVSEDAKCYRIKADIPGVSKQDIEIKVDGHLVSISAEMKKEVETKGENSIHRERSEGQVYRAFTLPMEVDSKGAEAKYENGVLMLTLTKKSNGNGSRIKVN